MEMNDAQKDSYFCQMVEIILRCGGETNPALQMLAYAKIRDLIGTIWEDGFNKGLDANDDIIRATLDMTN
jgi:hypothetical protein